MPQSISQVDQLGRRLRLGIADDQDVSALSEYQEEFQPLFRDTLRLVGELSRTSGGRNPIGPTGRVKQLRSIVEKLERKSTRLAQLQDIVGCRLIVETLEDQNAVVAALPGNGEWKVCDRRNDPEHGYRAVHAVRSVGIYRVEVQVRTVAQQLWADLSESLDRYSPGLKYGRGHAETLQSLNDLSQKLARIEAEAPGKNALHSDQLAGERTGLLLTMAGMLVVEFLKSKRKKEP